MYTELQVYTILNEIPDPEIPVISIIDLGVIRKVEVRSEHAIGIHITPTYSGCPAMKQMEDDVRSKLTEHGFTEIEVKTVYDPAWTTDWISDDAKARLVKYGIAAPEHSSIDKKVLLGVERVVKCPQCKSTNTEMISQFGSTACKSLYRCKDCLEPFDYFKCI